MTVSSPGKLGTAGSKGHGVGVENVQVIANGLAQEKVQLESIRIHISVSPWRIASSSNVNARLESTDKGRRMVRDRFGELGVNDVPGVVVVVVCVVVVGSIGSNHRGVEEASEGHGSKSEFHGEV